MNLFRIDFYQGKTDEPDYGQVKHSLVDGTKQRAVISLTVSSDKLQSVSNYTREPKRLVFECFLTDWIRDNILSGDHEHERYISHFEVKAYRDDVLFFTGIIDTSQLSYDISSDIIKFTCYDRIKLLSIYSDLERWYSLVQGYEPFDILVRFLLHIRLRIPIGTPALDKFTLPVCNNMLTIATVDYADMYIPPAIIPVSGAAGYTYSVHEDSWLQPKFGYWFSYSNITFCFAHKLILHADHGMGGPEYFQCRTRGKIYRFFNGICPVVYEYDNKTGWDTLENVDNTDGLMEFFTENGVPSYKLDELVSGGVVDGKGYGSSQTVGQQVTATYSGNIYPNRLQPGATYVDGGSDHTGMLKVLQAMLLLYNATLYTDAHGRIVLANKDAYSPAIVDIDERDVVSFVTKRSNQEEPKVTEIDVLAGDTTQLQALIKQRLTDFYDGRWSIDATIDKLSKYNLKIQDKIRIKDHVYALIDVGRDHEKDEYKVKAWRLT